MSFWKCGPADPLQRLLVPHRFIRTMLGMLIPMSLQGNWWCPMLFPLKSQNLFIALDEDLPYTEWPGDNDL